MFTDAKCHSTRHRGGIDTSAERLPRAMPYAPTQEELPLATDVTVTNNPDRNRYEAVVDTETVAGFVEYQETDELVVLTHTEVDRGYEGRGVGGALARAALDDIGERKLKALVICPFILGWLRNHPEHRGLLFNAPPSRVSD
jgi:uncharacterized protein